MNYFTLNVGDLSWSLTGVVHDLAIPVHFNGPQPNHFGAPSAIATPLSAGDFVGDTRKGGSCNCESITMVPHCNGTHTECVGHITDSRVAVAPLCPALPILSLLMTVSPVKADHSGDALPDYADGNDSVIDARTVTEALSSYSDQTLGALLVRTLPNFENKTSKSYRSADDCPYLTTEAVQIIVDTGIDHLLVDMPSIDRYSDAGFLAGHRVFFGLPDKPAAPTVDIADAQRAHTTITEMIYASDDIADGLYALNLQVPAFDLDAAPSRPLLYELQPL